MLSSLIIFESLVALHITSGSIGLVSFWVPVGGRKGGAGHRRYGNVFINTMLITGTAAIGISLTTLFDPTGTHPHLADHELFSNPAMIQGIFGWMMLYLAILTINLAWQGRLCLRNRNNHAANGAWHNLLLQVLLTLVAANCAWQGWRLGQLMMVGISMVGFATVATNLWFIYKPNPRPVDRLKEHIKSLVGAGISVYTAFFAFGAVRLMPELALTPGLWAVPLVTGISLILYHQRAITRRFAPAAAAAT
jgi:hypothetical protein